MLPSFFLSHTGAFLTGMFAGLYAFFGLPAVAGTGSNLAPLFIASYFGYFCSNILMYILGRFSAHGIAKIFSFFRVHMDSTKEARKLLTGKNFFLFSFIIPFFLDSAIYFTCGLLRMNVWKFVPILVFINFFHAILVTFLGQKLYNILTHFTNHPELASFFVVVFITALLLRKIRIKKP